MVKNFVRRAIRKPWGMVRRVLRKMLRLSGGAVDDDIKRLHEICSQQASEFRSLLEQQASNFHSLQEQQALDFHSLLGKHSADFYTRTDQHAIELAILHARYKELQFGRTLLRHKQKHGILDEQAEAMQASSLANRHDLFAHSHWAKKMGFKAPQISRKYWEYVYVAQVLLEQGMLKPGKRGLGFAVGKELLPALFATFGVKVTASDLGPENTETERWSAMGVHSKSLSTLEHPKVCDKKTFYKNVDFMPLDMNNIPDTVSGYDFCWSNCSFEHLGNQGLGRAFIINSLKVLKPGGISVHTTEFHLGGDNTVDDVPFCTLYGKDFLDDLRDEITAMGHYFAPLDYRLGDHPDDDFVYSPRDPSAPHFKLSIDGNLVTSLGLFIRAKP